jgi:CheY-like chemotaxis protein
MLGIGASRNLPTVLIIDDDLVAREVMATVFTMTGYTIHTATHGEDALALLDAGTCFPQVILMDAQMPGLKGVSLVRELRVRTKASIYAMSGSALPDDVISSVDGHLAKPFGPDALKQLMKGHLSSRRVSDSGEDAPVVNHETLTQLRSIMAPRAVREIYVAVVDDLDRRDSALRQALAVGDANEIRRLGHAIKGGCGVAGALQAAHLGALLEAEGDQLDNVPHILIELKAATENLRRMLEAEFPAS